MQSTLLNLIIEFIELFTVGNFGILQPRPIDQRRRQVHLRCLQEVARVHFPFIRLAKERTLQQFDQ